MDGREARGLGLEGRKDRVVSLPLASCHSPLAYEETT